MRLPGPTLSVRTRLTLWYSAVLLAIVVTIGALSYSWLRVGLLQDLDASLLTVAQVVRDVDAANQVNVEREKELRAAFDAQKAKVLAMTSQRDELNVLQKDVESAQRAYDLAKQRLSMNSLASQIDHSNVTLLAEARPPSSYAKPKISLNTMIGGLLGLLLGLTSAVVWEYFEPRLRSPAQASQVLGLLVLGSMPQNRPPLTASLRTALRLT